MEFKWINEGIIRQTVIILKLTHLHRATFSVIMAQSVRKVLPQKHCVMLHSTIPRLTVIL